jgi:hypothetical protein
MVGKERGFTKKRKNEPVSLAARQPYSNNESSDSEMNVSVESPSNAKRQKVGKDNNCDKGSTSVSSIKSSDPGDKRLPSNPKCSVGGVHINNDCLLKAPPDALPDRHPQPWTSQPQQVSFLHNLATSQQFVLAANPSMHSTSQSMLVRRQIRGQGFIDRNQGSDLLSGHLLLQNHRYPSIQNQLPVPPGFTSFAAGPEVGLQDERSMIAGTRRDFLAGRSVQLFSLLSPSMVPLKIVRPLLLPESMLAVQSAVDHHPSLGLQRLVPPLPGPYQQQPHIRIPEQLGHQIQRAGPTAASILHNAVFARAALSGAPIDSSTSNILVAARAAAAQHPILLPSILCQQQDHPYSQVRPNEPQRANRTCAAPTSTWGHAVEERAQSSNKERPRKTGRTVPIALEDDKLHLSKFQCLARQQIELFEATKEVAAAGARGRNTPIVVGQVGIRCRHCSQEASQKSRGAVYFPSIYDIVYQTAVNMTSVHLCTHCKLIPQSIRDELLRLKEQRSNPGSGKTYWAEGIERLGVIETNQGLRFVD